MSPHYEHYGVHYAQHRIGSERNSINTLIKLPESGYEAHIERMRVAATPLNPYFLTKDGVAYTETAPSALEDLFINNLKERVCEDTAPSPHIVDLLRGSLLAALFQRFDKHNGITISPDSPHEVVDLYARACLGMASPSQLVDLLIKSPEIKALELAKVSHPFEWLERHSPIDNVIDSTIKDRSAEVLYKNPEYYLSAVDDPRNPSAAVMVRKIYRGTLKSDQDESVHIIQRDMFILDLNHPDTIAIQKELRKWFQATEASDYGKGGKIVRYSGVQLAEFLNYHLDRDEEYSRAIEPGVCSYYAFKGQSDTIDLPIGE
jgi:hypothetical protein